MKSNGKNKLILKLSDQLGNQMFAYASVKSVALDLNLDFGFFNSNSSAGLCNDTDKTYGHSIETIFENTSSEALIKLPLINKFFRENTTINCQTAYKKEIYKIRRSAILEGHYICPLYFEHRIDEVREWFRFPKEIDKISQKLINDIRQTKINIDSSIISVHFRNANDYKLGGYMLNESYWYRSANVIIEQIKNPVFVVFYDKETELIRKFIKKYKTFKIHNSLVIDMCAISKCDAHIVCNSSFSIMSALLNKNKPYVIRPSKFYIPDGNLPDDVFPSDWIIVKANKNKFLDIKRKIKLFKSGCNYSAL